ncbi:hypothetical protein KKC17_00715 [Patescibacteria group bacterium]|nr:hypothetical protein [Patescibacteria group bacterium]
MSKIKRKTICVDCGSAPTSHRLAWWTSLIDQLLKPYIKVLEKIAVFFQPLRLSRAWHKLAYTIMLGTARLGLAEIVEDLRPDHNSRTKVLWQEALRRGIVLKEWRLFKRPTDIMVASLNGHYYIFDGLPRPVGPTIGLSWMDDKAIMRQKFQAAGLPIARGGSAVLVKKALSIFDKLGGPLIVKPRFGSRSRHTFSNIMTRSQLVKAFYSAQKISPWVIIEEQLTGEVHRATVIKLKLQAVARRELASVLGDGLSTIDQLVDQINQQKSGQAEVFSPVIKNQETESELTSQGYNWLSVPGPGTRVFLNRKVNRGLGGATIEVTDQVHPQNRLLFERAASVVADSIIGFDMILEDISRPWQEQPGSGIIECNSLPFIDLHHFPLRGNPQNVAAAIWDLIWPLRVVVDPVKEVANNPDHLSYPYRKDV